jgi:hypothetical protein
MRGRPTPFVASVGAGLAVGSLSALGRNHFQGTLEALANSTSTWLVAPFVIGALAGSRRDAAVAGLATCVFQLAGYYLVADLIGAGTAGPLVAFWTACGLLGGPLFGLAGHQCRQAAPAGRELGVALLAGVFVAEGLYAYVHEQHRYSTGALWVAFGLTLALLASRGRAHHLRWLGVTVPLGIAGEVVLTLVRYRFF